MPEAPDPTLPKPRSYDDLCARIRERRERLPARLAQVANHMLMHPDEVAFGTVATVAGAAGVQPSALVRFAKALDFDGFSDLQAVFRDRLRGRLPEHRERLRRIQEAEGEHGPLRLLERFEEAAQLSLDRLGGSVDEATLAHAVALLARADTIYILGLRRAFPIAAYLAYALAKLDLRSVLVDHVGASGPEQIVGARAGDVLLAVSFTPYTPATVELANAFAQGGRPVVAITDSPFSPLAQAAAARFDVAEADVAGFRSLSATFCLAAALAVATAERRARDGSDRPAEAWAPVQGPAARA
ncbi:MurR/RpiR family transcriptional regulator [Salinarimonas soli]|uniref:MurR/RpiR family transcriptional regulator n=1 Tax=Salinarimonas soli TaxID=1638099 RepID=A0A5B2V880_9HYPH|nr:MurR/RpiR family transcriptional regulator [Salinarimonas soli]KAA2234660.1 MurR/RpiR family transcriptional regulator [Salinarimonas soli]